jgi:hypothetical protein
MMVSVSKSMALHPTLRAPLERVARRQQRVRLWFTLTCGWVTATVAGVILLGIQRQAGWSNALLIPGLALAGITAALIILFKNRGGEPDWRKLALQIEAHHPELEGRLLTAVQMTGLDSHENAQAAQTGELNYLQDRLLREVLNHNRLSDWGEIMPASRVALAQGAHWVAVVLFCLVLSSLHAPKGRARPTGNFASGISVSPGDTTIERGQSLVVMARFNGPLPSVVDLVVGPPGGDTRRISLAKSLADPMFGGSLPEVPSNLVYHVEYAGQRTRDYKVTVFEYPRLEHSDADLVFPAFTGLEPKHITETRRLSAVEGSRLDLTLRFNKSVASARLVARDPKQAPVPLRLATNDAAASLPKFPLIASGTYELRLVDAEGRTNKVPAQFVFEVLKNRPPEIHLAAPRGDLRPSPLEEIRFEGTVWDDFGVKAFGLGYTIAGQETKIVELGRDVPGREKHPFQYMLRLEDLGAQPDELISWFVWADDLVADGSTRRTTGDLFFGEVRPFEEVFRPSQMSDAGSQQAQQASGPAGGQSAKLAELQKQIISATWKLQREHAGSNRPAGKASGSTWIRRKTPVLTQRRPTERSGGSANTNRLSSVGQTSAPSYAEDATVVHDAQADALEQAEAAMENEADPKSAALWQAATKDMEKALARLREATNSPAALADALAAEQTAYQALLKLQQHEYQVARRQSRNQSGSAREQQMQRQLEQMDLAKPENRYETQRQAQQQQPNNQRREQLQVMNRLQELARRQQDMNERLKELQTALQEARTETEREEIQRRLKRLQEEEQQMLGDVDELRQRMDQPENQSQMAEQRQQLDQTRNEVQRAAEAAAEGAASRALAAGTRAQSQLQQMRDQLRKETSSQFAEDLRDMRAQARELAQKQEEIGNKMDAEAATARKSLGDSPDRKEMLDQIDKQKDRLTNLVERATQVSQTAEEAEPLLSRQLYDTVRKFTQDSSKDVKELQEQLISRRLMTQSLYDRLQDSAEPDGAKLEDITSEMVRLHFANQATETSQRARADLENLKRGVERAAESVLGDDLEALRQAQSELQRLSEQVGREIAQAEREELGTNRGSGMAQAAGGRGTNNLAGANSRAAQPSNQGGQPGRRGDVAQNGNRGNQPGADQSESQRTPGARGEGQPSPGEQAGASPGERQPGDNPAQGGTRGEGQANQNGGNQRDLQAQAGQNGQNNQDGQGGRDGRMAQNGDRRGGAQNAGQRDSAAAGGWGGGDLSGSLGRNSRTFLDDNPPLPSGPITGDNFTDWSDRLRDVEEMIDQRDLRNAVAAARDRARTMRQDFKKDRKKPDWAVVRMQVMQPLIEVRDRIADELARRESREAMVPLDRDPVPARYSDLVRRYYEELGKDK